MYKNKNPMISSKLNFKFRLNCLENHKNIIKIEKIPLKTKTF